MPFFDHYPYTNLHNVNLDWVLQKVKDWGEMVEQNNQNFIDLQAANESFKEYVTSYITNLDVQEEINNKLDDMLSSGALTQYFSPYIKTDVEEWLEENITPTTPAVDASLSIAGAAADAKATGDKISELNDVLTEGGTVTNLVIEQGAINANGSNVNSNYRVRAQGWQSVSPNSPIKISFESPYTILLSVWFYDRNHTNVKAGSWSTNRDYITPEDAYYIRIVFARAAATTTEIAPADVTNAMLIVKTLVGAVRDGVNLIYDSPTYAIPGILGKIPINVETLGTLTYLQSFCFYNNHYYSTEGTHIAKQDSDFALVSDTEIAVGHGNSMQLGNLHPNYAYISGWDDNKLYVVDLDTVTLVDTITLPTTGYTTEAVDDLNGIAYIFQRDSYPTTEVYYNFIVYDYINEEIIRTCKTPRKFGVMQSVDFVEGKIFVVNGSQNAPGITNYYITYDTNGNIIGEIIYPDLDNTEPEGVYLDRDYGYVLLSTFHKTVYKLTSAL